MEIRTRKDYQTDDIMRLIEVPKGTKCRMIGIADEGRNRPPNAPPITDFGCSPNAEEHHTRAVVKRLCDLGLTPGIVLTKMEGQGRGPVVIMVRGTKLALGYGVASKILVVPESQM